MLEPKFLQIWFGLYWLITCCSLFLQMIQIISMINNKNKTSTTKILENPDLKTIPDQKVKFEIAAENHNKYKKNE